MNQIFIIKYRWPIIIATTLFVLASLLPITTIKINSDLESYFPDSMESKMNDDKIKGIDKRLFLNGHHAYRA